MASAWCLDTGLADAVVVGMKTRRHVKDALALLESGGREDTAAMLDAARRATGR